MQKIKLIALFIITLSGLSVFSQNISPESKISICEGYLQADEALKIIENKYNIKFSYNPNLFSIENEIYICKRNKSLEEVISYIMGTHIVLITEGNYFIIKPDKKHADNEQNTYKTIKINGIIENAISGAPIENAIIETYGYKFYTDEVGYFNIKVNLTNDSLTLFINKENYIGYKTRIPAESQNVKIKLQRIDEVDYTYLPSTVKDKNSTIETYWLSSLVLNDNQTELNKDRKVLLERDYQISVIPSIGRYSLQSGMYRYNRSYNILAGYTGEVYGHEIGLGVNIVRFDMTGFQASGIANIVGGETAGFQFSGGANVCIGNVKGVQFAGTANTSWGHFKGVQISAGANLVKSKLRGYQIAPVNIVIDTLLGCQTGAVNIVTAPAQGAQISAVMNYTPLNDFLQYSTLLNITKQNRASQIGLINIGGYSSKFQLGLLNFADTVSGISIGFLSFVKNGYTHLDIDMNTGRFAEVKFKTGTNKFYNIIKAQVRPENEADFGIGYGFGTDFKIWKFISFTTDLTASHIFENNTLNQNLNILSNLDLCLNFNIARHFTLFTGFETNLLLTNQLNTEGTEYQSSLPTDNLWYDQTFNNQRVYIWPGIKLGIRI